MISLTPIIPVPANTCGHHPDVTVDQYYQIYYEGGYFYQGNSPEIPVAWDLPGYGQNQQLIYSHSAHHPYRDPENFIHIELDELPNAIQDTVTAFYLCQFRGPVTFSNFYNALAYYRPAFQSLMLAMTYPPMVDAIDVYPPTLHFPSIPVLETDTLSLRFQNHSPTDTLLVQNVFCDSIAFSIIYVPVGMVLNPGQQCSVQVVFHPQNILSYQKILTFSTNQGCRYVELQGTGLGAIAFLFPPYLNFNAIPTIMGAFARTSLQNIGNFPMRLVSVVDSPPHFLCSWESPDSIILPFGQLPLNVVFLPQTFGLFQDTLYVITNAFSTDTLMLRVRGEGGFMPAAPTHLTISKHNSHVILTWNGVHQTFWGSPMTASAYSIYFAASPVDSFRFLAQIPDTTFAFSVGFPEPNTCFYQVRAQVDSSWNLPSNTLNHSYQIFQPISP
jgi:hypothetical protein